MSTLPTQKLGRTDLQVTMLGYGAMELWGSGHGRAVEPREAETILNTVLDSGINFIDTSIDYGQSEESIGKCISHRRSEYFLATKCGCLVGAPQPQEPTAGPRPHLFTRENIEAGVHQSLTRMKTDYIDLLQFHLSPSKETLDENDAMETVVDLQRQGKVRFIGISSTLPNLADHIAMGVFDAFQIPYSALQREHEEVITEAARKGAGIVIRGGAAKGGPSEGKEQGATWDLWQQAKLDEILDGMTRMEFILRFTFSHPDLHTNIVGTLNPDHLKENVKALEAGPLPPDLLKEATRRLAASGVKPQGS